MAKIDVFVVGLDDANLRTLRDVPEAVRYEFHGLLSVAEIQHGEIPIVELLDKARSELDSFDGTIGAVVGYWDFPVTSIVPILCGEYGLPSTSLEAVLKCEHKYWSRLEQQKVTDGVPPFGLVDLSDPICPEGLRYPIWLKPVKSFSSELAFQVESDEQLVDAVRQISDGIERVGKPFEYVMEQVQLPDEIAKIGGSACLAEQKMDGLQAATEGYMHGGRVTVNGTLDSLSYRDMSSFERHRYPSELPDRVVRRMEEVSEAVMSQIGLDNSTFSIEFFCDVENESVQILEINARHSQSHSELFEYVDGFPNHYCMLQLGLGRDPAPPRGEGPYQTASKWYFRKFSDAFVQRVPMQDELDALYRRIPGVVVDIQTTEGTWLSEMSAQDSYSFELAYVYVGGDDDEEVRRKYRDVVDHLEFEFGEEEPYRHAHADPAS
ncbi:ATP-grasp domain-containing protein [Rhodococcus sp. NPDC058521]|uniref:ATP-grasp domain-containing protein n=1 Tax=Rhodococcus sp. NPDC058521 TaxID=3346536 RepID=UPI003668E46B